MTFYPDQKEGMSPSALAQWLQSRSSFVKTYFQGEKGPETAAMKGGTVIHRLIEAGLVKAQHVFDIHEEEIRVEIKPGFVFRGKPDSRDAKAEENVARHGRASAVARFVDYKSGKANDWKDKLPTDIKMRATAYLVWKATGMPSYVLGSIEFIQTTWDIVTKSVIPVDGKETEIIEIEYTYAELAAFESVILKEMSAVNDFYVKWQSSTDQFVDKRDIAEYAEIDAEITRLEARKDSLKESILSQMEFGGVENLKTPHGTFYTTTRETYDYPDALPVGSMTLKEAEDIGAKAKAAKKNYELANEPISIKVSVGFRPAKN